MKASFINISNQKKVQCCIAIIALCSFLSFVNFSFGQTPIHHIYDFEKGLPSSEAYDCFQDENNNIWIATDNGVSKFNSREFRNYTIRDGLPGPVVFKIFQDENGTLWFTGHNRSICFYDSENDRFIPYQYNDVLAKTDKFAFITKLKVLNDSQSMSIQANSGSFIIDGAGELRENYINKYSYAFKMDSINDLSIGSAYRDEIQSIHLSVYDQCDTVITIDPKHIYRQGSVNSLQISKTEFIFYFRNVLVHLKDKQLRTKIVPDVICDVSVWKNELYLGLYSDGLLSIDLKSLEIQDQLFKGHTISGLMVDHENSLWATSTELGLIYLPYSHFEHFLKDFNSRNIVDSKQFGHRIFFVTKSHELYEFDVETKQTRHIFKKGERYSFDSKIIIYDGIIHAKSRNGREVGYNIVENKFINKQYPGGQIILNDSISLIAAGNGLFSKNINFNQLRDTIIFGNYVSKIFRHTDQQFLISSKPGLFSLNAKNINDFKLKTINTHIDPTSFSRYGNDVVVTTKSNGIWIYRNHSLRLLSEKLPKIRYSGCAVKGKVLYFSSSNGLYIYHVQTDQVIHFGKYEGLSNIDLLNVFIGKDDNIWLLSRSEMAKFDQHLETPNFQPTIAISDVISDADTITNNTFQHDHKVIEFHLESICYKCLEDVTFKYRMVGISNDWLTTNQTHLRFNRLPAGDYTFEVMALTPGGEASKIQSYRFTIPLPFWKTWYFVFLICFLVLLTGFTLLYFRRRAQEKKARLLERLTQNRQLSLRKYLNPHFIFNSLNSIQSYVVTGNKEEAQVFIARFSRLMREYLDAGVNEEISVKKELEILDKYVELEETRLQRELTFTFSASKEINLEKTMIPSFIIQPIIENSIWHGISKKQNCGTISMSLKRTEKVLFVTISDDGAGNGDLNEVDKNSKSMSINQERLELLSKLHKEKFEIRAENRRNTNGEIVGYKVEVSLPFKLEHMKE